MLFVRFQISVDKEGVDIHPAQIKLSKKHGSEPVSGTESEQLTPQC